MGFLGRLFGIGAGSGSVQGDETNEACQLCGDEVASSELDDGFVRAALTTAGQSTAAVPSMKMAKTPVGVVASRSRS